jgi:hypothetical protein
MRAAPGQNQDWRSFRHLETFGGGGHLDGGLAPKFRPRDGGIGFAAELSDESERSRAYYSWQELPQGQFLRHYLTNGLTAISWWDRCQGDERGGCNSTILLEGEHTSEEMLEALERHFPRVLDNLNGKGIELVEVFIGPAECDRKQDDGSCAGHEEVPGGGA